MRSLQIAVVGCTVLVLSGWVAAAAPGRLPRTTGVGSQDPPAAILVTGASSGIGRTITEHLAARGHVVYAGARATEDLQELDAIENVHAVRLDVTVQEEIDAAVETIGAAGRPLHGIVNNAGVATVGPLIETEEDDLHFQLNVNVYGPYRITKAFAPLLLESGGRVVTIGSISGVLAGQFSGPYSMSKFAVEAFTDALAAEMEPLGVRVSVVEPGGYRSQISINMRDRMLARGRTFEGSRWEEQLSGFFEAPLDRSEMQKPVAVAEAVMHALFSESPKRRYMVVPNQQQAEVTIRTALRRVIELNHDHPHSYDRDQLVTMLDEALEAVEK